ncbi:MAG: FAD-dependent oxidoreductase [Eubacteriales bacterium]|nr:FAD-dependent oxidoreductase [Eubacteriales bacterium]
MRRYINEIPSHLPQPPIEKAYDVIVAGGGMSGLCAAIASARQGASTALVQDRSVFGGNASSETRMHISGASCHWGKKNAAETGILMELQLENKYLNDSYNYSIWDGVLWSLALNTPNLDCYLNTTLFRAHSDGETIASIACYQMNTERHFSMRAKIYIDCTGNGTLGYFAGAEYAIGREAKSDYGEPDAPDERDGETMGNTIYFVAQDCGHPVRFVKPTWAHSFDESDFKHRYHGDVVVYHNADDVVVLKPGEDYADHADELVEKYDVQSGYWWIELGGDWDDIIGQAEDIRYELYRCVYGVWDHIKNGGDHGADNYELVWVGNVAGTRESRRLTGDYILTEHDILAGKPHADEVAYGGWPMDEHVAGGFRAKGDIPSRVRSFKGYFTIPYGCYCSKNIRNLMMAGRNISASKLAMGATRVMGTCAVGGEAAGIAAAMAARRQLTPREFGQKHLPELQQELLKQDCYLVGTRNTDPADLARSASVTASSEQPGFEAAKVINGVARNTESANNLWRSAGIGPAGETLTLKLARTAAVSSVRLTLDPNLSEERCISVSKAFIDKEPRGVAPELLKDYEINILHEGTVRWHKQVRDNHQRLNVLDLPEAVTADEVQIRITATNGAPDAHIFEVRIY